MPRASRQRPGARLRFRDEAAISGRNAFDLNLKPEQSNIFFKLMEERYRQRSIIIATNLRYDEWPGENKTLLL